MGFAGCAAEACLRVAAAMQPQLLPPQQRCTTPPASGRSRPLHAFQPCFPAALRKRKGCWNTLSSVSKRKLLARDRPWPRLPACVGQMNEVMYGSITFDLLSGSSPPPEASSANCGLCGVTLNASSCSSEALLIREARCRELPLCIPRGSHNHAVPSGLSRCLCCVSVRASLEHMFESKDESRAENAVGLNVFECECLPAHQSQVSPPGLNHEASQAARVQKLKHQSGVC